MIVPILVMRSLTVIYYMNVISEKISIFERCALAHTLRPNPRFGINVRYRIRQEKLTINA